MATKATKVLQNSEGHQVFTLPVSGTEITLRSPKGKDLKALDSYLKANQGSDLDAMEFLATQLVISPELSSETLEDMDAEDYMELSEVLGNFRVFRKNRERA